MNQKLQNGMILIIKNLSSCILILLQAVPIKGIRLFRMIKSLRGGLSSTPSGQAGNYVYQIFCVLYIKY